MPAKPYTTEALWDLDPPRHLGRTSILPPQPIGMGTLHVESLTSYIARLAQSRYLTTEELLVHEVVPLMQHRGFEASCRVVRRLFSSRCSIAHDNETRGDLTRALIQAIEELTGQQNLSQLSLMTEASELFAFQLLHPEQAWCSLCYQEWQNDHRVIYTPLLWALDSKEACLRHPNQPLQVQCPYCQQRFLALARRSCPGYCSNCHRWLGSSDLSASRHEEMAHAQNSIFDDLFEHGLHWQYWWLDSSEQVVANTPAAFLPPKQDAYADPRNSTPC
jgi:TniQ